MYKVFLAEWACHRGSLDTDYYNMTVTLQTSSEDLFGCLSAAEDPQKDWTLVGHNTRTHRVVHSTNMLMED